MTVVWDNNTPRSTIFDDIYYNPQNGLEEKRFVFLKGNNLPDAWQNKENFTIAETGFGTGLNFFSTWKMFDEHQGKCQHLHYISFEKHPLCRKDIQRALSPWNLEWENRLSKFIDIYSPTPTGILNTFVTDNIELSLYFGEAATSLSSIEHQTINAWFLDGFAPAKNLDMWSDEVFKHIGRLSTKDTSFATFTAAGFVKRGLRNIGFNVQKVPGYGTKFERLIGTYL